MPAQARPPAEPRELKSTLRVWAESDVGRNPNRPRNEDWVYFSHQPNDPVEDAARAQRGDLFIVCDGMGGRDAGQEASDIAGNMIRRQYYYVQPDDLPVDQALSNALSEANQEVFRLSSQQGTKWFGMGTTAVVAVVKAAVLHVVNIGDSRAYHISSSGIRQVSRDHTWVREALDAGRIDEETARRHPNRGALTRSIGNQQDVQPEVSSPIPLSAGDAVVLCSDGLTDVVSDQEIERLARENEPRAAAARLVALANSRGGPDNVSAIVVRLGNGLGALKKPARQMSKPMTRAKAFLLAVILILAVGAFALAAGLWILRDQDQQRLPTVTPTAALGTPVPTGIATFTPAAKGTLAPSSTAAPSSTPTNTPTWTPTPTHTPTPTKTATPVPTLTLTPVPTPDDTGSSKPPSTRP